MNIDLEVSFIKGCLLDYCKGFFGRFSRFWSFFVVILGYLLMKQTDLSAQFLINRKLMKKLTEEGKWEKQKAYEKTDRGREMGKTESL